MLTTLHRQGVAVWGGPQFQRLMRFSHPMVRLLEFSPNEKFLVSYSVTDPARPNDDTIMTFTVFDVRSGKKMRTFEGPSAEFVVGGASQLKWPVFKWAGGKEDKYFARLGKGIISVYETPDMGLLDKKSLKMDAVQDFEWSPSEPIIAAYTNEQGNLPARVVLTKIPERTEIRQKNLFNVSGKRLCRDNTHACLGMRIEASMQGCHGYVQ